MKKFTDTLRRPMLRRTTLRNLTPLTAADLLNAVGGIEEESSRGKDGVCRTGTRD
jgi:hypothetical protein